MADDNSAPGERSEQPTVESLTAKVEAQRAYVRDLEAKLKAAQNERADLLGRLGALITSWSAADGTERDVVGELERAIQGPPVKLKSQLSKQRDR